jgi:acyl phosphate:glycerol-3-phosphate acyltransferase
MTPWTMLGVAAAAYVIGSVPIGVLVVRWTTGKEVLNEHSGRTGGTNVMRTAGIWAGLVTGIGDVLKGAGAVYLARQVAPAEPWLHAVAGVLAVLGHNHSIFLPEFREGRLRLRGGAGGASSVGAGMAMAPVVGFLVLLVPILLFGIGYASVTTLTVGLLATAIFAYRAAVGIGPWAYAAFGLAAEVLMALSLRSNLIRLSRGEERLVGWRARKKPGGDPPEA